MKAYIDFLSEATGIPIEDLEFKNEVQIIRPSEAIEAARNYHNQFSNLTFKE